MLFNTDVSERTRVLKSLIASQVQESRSLEFKRELNISSSSERKEFLADVSAFANTIGGEIIYGISELNGVAHQLSGIEAEEPEAIQIKIQDIVRTGLEPRLPSFEMLWHSLESGKRILILQIHRSWLSPHRVNFEGSHKFWGRADGKKFELDTLQLRHLFLEQESVGQRARLFHRERIAEVSAGDDPVRMGRSPKLFAHVIPADSFSVQRNIDVYQEENHHWPLVGMAFSGGNRRMTLEGMLTYCSVSYPDEDATRYALTFRNGIIETGNVIGGEVSGEIILDRKDIVDIVKGLFEDYIPSLDRLGINGSTFVLVSITSALGSVLQPRNASVRHRHPARRSEFFLPPQLVGEGGVAPDEAQRQILDSLWNAFGYRNYSHGD